MDKNRLISLAQIFINLGYFICCFVVYFGLNKGVEGTGPGATALIFSYILMFVLILINLMNFVFNSIIAVWNLVTNNLIDYKENKLIAGLLTIGVILQMTLVIPIIFPNSPVGLVLLLCGIPFVFLVQIVLNISSTVLLLKKKNYATIALASLYFITPIITIAIGVVWVLLNLKSYS